MTEVSKHTEPDSFHSEAADQPLPELSALLLENGDLDLLEGILHLQAENIRETIRKQYSGFRTVVEGIIVAKDYPEVFADLPLKDPKNPVLTHQKKLVFIQKIFNGGYPRVSPEYRLKLQQKIITLDSEIADAFNYTFFGRWSSELNDPTFGKLNAEELGAIQNLDEKLLTEPAYITAYQALDPSNINGGLLINSLQAQRKSIARTTQENIHALEEARAHQRAVAQVIAEYSGSPLLKLVASVHDFFKLRVTERHVLVTELGLHEVGSAGIGRIIGSMIGEYFLAIFPDLPEALVQALGKYFFMIIGTHGAGEYPRLTSFRHPLRTAVTATTSQNEMPRGDSQLNYLGDSVYPPVPTPETKQFCQPNVPEEGEAYCRTMARQLNAADMLTGTSLPSLSKYNRATPTQELISYPSMKEYLEQRIFASLVDNFNSESARHLGWSDGQFTKQKILDSKRRIALLMGLITKQDNHQALTNVVKIAESLANHFVGLKDFISQPKTLPNELSEILESTQRFLFDKHFQELTEAVAKIDLDSLERSVLKQIDETWEEIEEFEKNKKTAFETSNE